MHVLITSDTVGGVWTYTRELVTGLALHGHSVTLVSFGKLPSPDQTLWLRQLESVDYRPTEYRLEWMEVAEHDIEESRRYLKLLIREVQPDVLHFSQYCIRSNQHVSNDWKHWYRNYNSSIKVADCRRSDFYW